MDLDKAFSGELIYPRQLQLYMPGGCNFRCYYCAGRYSNTKSIHWEETGLELMDKLGSRIPYHQYTGCSTEPTLNPYFLRFLEATKQNGCYFGIKTNGSRLKHLENSVGFLSRLCDISTSFEDYISISLDAGFSESHEQTKGSSSEIFSDIIEGIESLCSIRGSRSYPAIRISYLLNKHNDSEQEIRQAINIAVRAGVDSIRFSQPHPAYMENPRIADEQWKEIAHKNAEYIQLFSTISTSNGPAVFYDSPFGKPNLYFNRCAYGYYQITLSQDGFLYRCTTVVGLPDMRLGKVSSNIAEFEYAIKHNQDESFSPGDCLEKGVYCCRAAMTINQYYE